MYSPLVVDKARRKLEQGLGLKLHPYSPTDSQSVSAHLEALVVDNKLKRPLTADERAFILNERLLCKIDFRYFAERYGTINLDGAVGLGIGRPQFWESQELTLALISKIEEENFALFDSGDPCPGVCIAQHKSRQLGACLGAGTHILTSDLHWVPIESVRVGDRIVAVDEDRIGKRGVGRKMRVATVQGTCSMTVPTYRMVLDDGTTFVSTPHHRFLCRKHGWEWCEVRKLKPGDEVRRLSDRWKETEATYEDGWFGGLLDGEGSIGAASRSGADVCISQVPGDVLDRAAQYLTDRGYKYRVEIDDRVAGASSKFGSKEVHKLCVSNMIGIFRLLGITRPARFVNREWYVGKEIPNKHVSARVVSVQESLVQRVYDLQTDTGTYVAEGFVSHNTMMARLMTDHRIIFWPYTRSMGASVDEPKVQDQLYGRDKVCYDNLPWFLKPSIKFDVKNKHLAFTTGSYVMYQQANQESGIGQGSQFDISHLTEVASWPYPNIIELDFIPTIPQSPYAFCILESTAQGRGDWWHEFTDKVKMGKMYGWHYCFWPWYINKSKYRAKPPDDWRPAKVTELHAKMVAETSTGIIGSRTELTREQLFWYEMKYNNAREKGELNLFLMNYAATSNQSFQHSTTGAFDAELLDEFRMTVEGAQHRSYNFIPDVQRTQ